MRLGGNRGGLVRFDIRGDYSISADDFWAGLFFEPRFVNDLHLRGLRCASFAIIDEHIDDFGRRTRVLRAQPEIEIPGPLRRLLGQQLEYEERGVFDPIGKTWSTVTVLPAIGERLTVHATMSFRDIGPNRSERTVSFSIEANIFGLSRILRSFARASLEKAYEEARVYTNQWVSENHSASQSK